MQKFYVDENLCRFIFRHTATQTRVCVLVAAPIIQMFDFQLSKITLSELGDTYSVPDSESSAWSAKMNKKMLQSLSFPIWPIKAVFYLISLTDLTNPFWFIRHPVLKGTQHQK